MLTSLGAARREHCLAARAGGKWRLPSLNVSCLGLEPGGRVLALAGAVGRAAPDSANSCCVTLGKSATLSGIAHSFIARELASETSRCSLFFFVYIYH